MTSGSAHTTIGRLSERTGTRVETIRYYERVGLLPEPVRSAGGYRLYGVEQVKRLTFIRRARGLGFSIHEVRTLLQLADERQRPCGEVRVVAQAHLGDVRGKIADLKAMERVLRQTVARCGNGTRAHCPVIEALYREAPSPPVRSSSALVRRLPRPASARFVGAGNKVPLRSV